MYQKYLFRGDVLVTATNSPALGGISDMAQRGDFLFTDYYSEFLLFKWIGIWDGPLDDPKLLKHYKTLALLQAHPGGQS